MHRNVPVVRAADEPFDKAFRLMQENAIPALPVVDRLGKLRGLITPEKIGELMMMSSLPKGGQAAWREAAAGDVRSGSLKRVASVSAKGQWPGAAY
jgi:CBS-domain-containing membrane protein